VIVWIDNVTLKYFSTQPKLSSKQVRWQDTLALFNVDIRHKPGKENIVPDALSQKHQLRVVYVGKSELQKELKLVKYRDAFAKEVRQSIQNGAKSHFHLRNGLLWYKQNRLYVPEGKIRDTLLKECHDGPLCGPWWCKSHHNIPKEVLLLAQLEGLCGGVCEDLFNLSTKPDPQQEASGFIATFANPRRAVGKCVNGLYGKFAPFKGV
jgi:hypothetical protein